MFLSTPLLMIEDDAALVDLVASLRPLPAIAVDTEADSFHHYQEKLCLIQISDEDRDIIVDPLKVRDLSPLAELFQNPDQVKVFHGADYDVVSLKRDYGFVIHNLFDTMIASQFLGLPRIGLADLLDRFFGVEVDKRYQRHDWARRPLLQEHLDYARGDTHFLLALRDTLSHKLAEAGRLEHVREECALVEAREWSGRAGDPGADFLRIKGAHVLDEGGLRVLRALVRYRDEQARQLDRPAFKTIPDQLLLALAEQRPTEGAAMAEVLRPSGALARRHGDALLRTVAAGLADTEPLPDRNRPASKRASPQGGGANVDRLLGPLKTWRNHVVSSRKISPTVVASNTLLKEIARVAPEDLEALRAVPGIRRWQVQDFGEELVALVADNSRPVARPEGRRRRRRRR